MNTLFFLRETINGENPATSSEIESTPKVNHLRIFGFPVYINIPKEKRKKLDPSRKKGIFVGYYESLKATKSISQDTRILTL